LNYLGIFNGAPLSAAISYKLVIHFFSDCRNINPDSAEACAFYIVLKFQAIMNCYFIKLRKNSHMIALDPLFG